MKARLTPTNIDWTDFVWNPMSGCTKLSEGCENCYAADMAKRLQRIQETTGKDLGYSDGFAVTLHPERLEAPLNHKKGAKVFVNSMGDLFHEDVPFEFIDRVFAVMAVCPQHTFQVLAKRPERMREYILWQKEYIKNTESALTAFSYKGIIQNIWLGVTIESPKHKDRADDLRNTPAAKRFLSLEPLIEDLGELNLDGIDWVIVGGETGANARPMHPDWVASIKAQCEAAGVAFFFKQWGEYITLPVGKLVTGYTYKYFGDGRQAVKIGTKNTGHLIDGKEYREYPEANQ
ncbi:MAG: phage Gp37/Gp68 family protein [Campylobacterales bacterium]|nr:phage Gp37/Gp68 family protein [Campylobacterales bacterium]